MKFIFRLLTLISFTILLSSCDPAQNIDFINKTESPVKIKIKINSNNTNWRLKEFVKGDSIVLEIRPKGTESLYFGMGTWEENEVDETVKSIDNIEIETEDIKTIYKSRKSIAEILKNNRKGLWWKTNIEIEVE